MNVVLLLLLSLSTFLTCLCYPQYLNDIATDTVPIHCENQNVFYVEMIGHGGLCGKESAYRNQFGEDYSALKQNLTDEEIWPVLCHMDSDNDTRTNGQELGDPDCLWRKCTSTSTTHCTKPDPVSHPGFAETYDAVSEKFIISEDHGDYYFLCENLQNCIFRTSIIT